MATDALVSRELKSLQDELASAKMDRPPSELFIVIRRERKAA